MSGNNIQNIFNHANNSNNNNVEQQQGNINANNHGNNQNDNVIQVIQNKFNQIDAQIDAMPRTIVNTMRIMGDFEVSAEDNNIPDKKQLFLSYKNTLRAMNGLNSLPYIFCKVCKQVNMHFTQNCPRIICNYCLESGHMAKVCSKRMLCQICGELGHPTAGCTKENATTMRIMMNKTCMLCNCKGHIARDCGVKGSGYVVTNMNYRKGYGTGFKRWTGNRKRNFNKIGKWKNRYKNKNKK
jgi:hypothetical protein